MSPGACHVTAVLLRLLRGLAAGAGVQEPSLAPAMAAATTFIAFVTAVVVPVAAAESGTRMVSPFSCFPVSSQW